MLFDDKNAEEFDFERDFPSKWKVEKAEMQRGMQTEVWEFAEAGTQMTTHEDKGVQTVKEPREAGLNESRLNNFLREATGLMEKELETSSRSRAFEGYEGLKDLGGDGAVYKDLHHLKMKDPEESNVRVSCCSWNCASTTIAIGHSANEDHHDWCGHATNIHVWSLTRRSFSPEEPYISLPVPTCTQCISYHPSDSEAFAAGGYSGELIYYSGKGEEAPLMSGTTNGHTERITALDWTPLGVDGRVFLLTAGLDGKILIWHINEHKSHLEPQKEFRVHAENLPRSLNLKSRTSAEVGITALSLDSEDKDGLVVGTEAGVILFTSIGLFGDVTTEDWIHSSSSASTLFSPVHKGQVMDLDFSPFQRHIFISSGSDMEIRLYSTLHPQTPLHTISLKHIASSLIWSKRSPTSFIYLSIDKLQTHDIVSGERSVPLEESPHFGKPVRFDISKDGKLAALGLKEGGTRILRIKEELVPESENTKLAAFISDSLKE